MLRVWDIKAKSQTQLGLQAFGEKEENQEKGEPVESCNHQSKVSVGLIFSNLKLYNSEIGFSM